MAFDFSDNVQKMYSALTSATGLRTGVANTLLSSGITAMQNKKYAQAASAFRQAAAIQPDLVEAYTYQGDAYARLGKKSEAIAAYKMSLKVDKSQDAVYTSLAGVYIDSGQPAEAEKVLKEGIKQNKLNTLAYYTLGQLQLRNKDYSAAEANFREVIKLEPKDGNGYYALGMALNGQQKFDEAIPQLQKATELKKNFTQAMLELGRAYAGAGDREKAQGQVDALQAISSSTDTGIAAATIADAAVSADELSAEIARPGLLSYNPKKSSLKLDMANVNLLLIDPVTFIKPGASKDVTVQFTFDSAMDIGSVTNPMNWRIGKASGGAEGLYNNGLYSARDTSVPFIPKRVVYDPTTRQATLTFSLKQKGTAGDSSFDPIKDGGTIDTKHLVFKFLGKDVNGKSMDPAADQYEGWKGGVY